MNTVVRLTSPPLEKGYRLVFGDPCEIRKREDEADQPISYSDAIFVPKNLFCLEAYDRSLFGRSRWALYVAETVDAPEKAIFIPNVFPGAKVLLEVRGKEKVTQARDWIVSLATKGDPAELHPSLFLRQNAIINTAFTARVPRKPLFSENRKLSEKIGD